MNEVVGTQLTFLHFRLIRLIPYSTLTTVVKMFVHSTDKAKVFSHSKHDRFRWLVQEVFYLECQFDYKQLLH